MEISRIPAVLHEPMQHEEVAAENAHSETRFVLIDKPSRLPRTGPVAVIPLRGIANVKAQFDLPRDRISICAGRGLIASLSSAWEVSPDTRTGAKVLLVRPSSADVSFIRQDQPLFTTSFSTLGLLHNAPEILSADRAECSSDAVMELLARAYDFHRAALSRLSGSYQHRVNVYRRLLEVRTELEVTAGVATEPIGSGTHISRSHFFQLFRAAFGIAPKKYGILARTVRAMNLLSWSNAPVKDVAILSGYQDRTAFARAFSTMTPYTPNQFRKLSRGADRVEPRVFFELMYEMFRCKMTDKNATDIRSFCNPWLRDC